MLSPEDPKIILTEETKVSFAFAADVSKQLITIASGTLALSITFLKEFVSGNRRISKSLYFGWLSLLFSLFFGFWALMAMTGTLAKTKEFKRLSVYDTNISLPAGLQAGFVLLGFSFMIYFAFDTIRAKSSIAEHDQSCAKPKPKPKPRLRRK